MKILKGVVSIKSTRFWRHRSVEPKPISPLGLGEIGPEDPKIKIKTWPLGF